MPRPIDRDDTYMPMLLKNIPSEVVAAYVAVLGFIASVGAPSWVPWIAFGIALVSVPLWLVFGQGVKSPLQIILSTVAFPIWDMSLSGGAFQTIPGYETLIGSVILVIFTMLVAPLVSMLIRKNAPA